MSLNMKYHKGLDHLHVNCEKPRAYFIPYQSENAALKDNRSQSHSFISLCGEWDFKFYPSLAELSEEELHILKLYRKSRTMPESMREALRSTLESTINLYLTSYSEVKSAAKRRGPKKKGE